MSFSLNLDIALPAASIVCGALYAGFFWMRLDAPPDKRRVVYFWRDAFLYSLAALALRWFFLFFPRLEPDHLFFGVVVLSGTFYGGYAFVRRHAAAGAEGRKAVNFWRDMFICFLFVFLLRGFFYDYFRIPSNSMMPTLFVGDVVLTDKNAYGYRLPVLGTRLTDGDAPMRGDIAVFRKPPGGVFYIKRIMGIPGDVVRYGGDKIVTINGEPLPQTAAALDGDFGGLTPRREELPGRGWHDMLLADSPVFFLHTPDAIHCQLERAPDGDALTCVVPPAHYFVLGDNRDRSNDSRFWGFVARDKMVGPAGRVLFNYRGLNRFWRSLLLRASAPEKE